MTVCKTVASSSVLEEDMIMIIVSRPLFPSWTRGDQGQSFCWSCGKCSLWRIAGVLRIAPEAVAPVSDSGDLPFPVYLIGSCLVAIAAGFNSVLYVGWPRLRKLQMR
ncbi:hypothetical protein KC19_2G295100 [Ceratodon purpureus]|uniref:Uncharacterized protein n=1 Tax=Ceratodon purpureus TaxID=3225 RepID=A0A8T0J0V5_CERPU|nr:hypothetical protein KC19_2G295100 [Ceratodon purpureus]